MFISLQLIAPCTSVCISSESAGIKNRFKVIEFENHGNMKRVV